MRFLLVAMAVFLAAGALTPTYAQSEPTIISSTQARGLAQQALQQGKPQVADALSSALLQQNPDDADALMVQAVLRRDAGQYDAARDFAARAYGASEQDALRFEAAMLAADALARQEKYMRAQFWLRRADQVAQDDARQQFVAQAYRAIQQRNPLQVNLRFSLKPSNNVNNGAETLEVTIGGLPFRLDTSGQQLGGVEASVGLSFGYRVSESQLHRTDLLGDISFRKVWLDSDAAALAPTARDSDYDYGVIGFGVRHQRLIWPELGASAVTTVVGQSWYGGDELARWAEVRLNQDAKNSEDSLFRYGVQARVEKRLDSGVNDNRSLGVSVEYFKSLGERQGYSLGATARNYWSDSATIDGTAFGVNAGRSFGRVGMIEPRVNLAIENRDFQKWVITAGGREDLTLSLQVNVNWPDVSYYGFVPQASITARRTWSDVDIYDRNELSFSLTAASRF